MNLKFKDISNAEINPGNFVVIEDPTKDARYFLKIDDVRQESDSVRVLSASEIQRGEDGKPQSVPFEFRLVRGIPQLGCVLDSTVLEDNVRESRAKGDVDNMIAYELNKVLSKRVLERYGMPMKQAVFYLQNLGLLDNDPEIAKKYLVNFRRRHGEIFESKGGYIYLIQGDRKSKQQGGQSAGSDYKKIRVDFNKFVLGARLVLESGVFGEVEFYNL